MVEAGGGTRGGDLRLADLLGDETEQRRSGWLLITLGLLVAMLAATVPFALPGRATGARTAQRTVQLDAATRADVYVAALSGGPVPHRLLRRVYVRDHLCADVVSVPVSRCHGPAVPPQVQARVRAVLGPAVTFGDDPPVPARTGIPVVTFGPLRAGVAGGRTTARLQMETVCGRVCGQGQTLVLRHYRGRWQVSGTTGPQWLS